jgi:hypothetical protein
LPSYLLRPRLQKLKRLTVARVREVAEEFKASTTATLLKFVKLNRYPLIVVCHDRNGRRWFQRSDMIPGWWFPSDPLDRTTFAADMLFNGTAEEAWPRKTGADPWFGFRNCDRFEVDEQSFMLPGNEVLTILLIPEEGLG